MKRSPFTLVSLIFFGLVFNFTSCQQKVETEEVIETKEENNVPMLVDTTYSFKFKKELDPLTVGKPFINQLFVDTLLVQMYTSTIKPGDSMALHQHPDHTVYVLKGGTLKLSFNGSDPVEMEFKEGTGFMSGPASDYAVNIGETDVSFLIHEIYRPRGIAKTLEDVDY